MDGEKPERVPIGSPKFASGTSMKPSINLSQEDINEIIRILKKNTGDSKGTCTFAW